MGHENCERAGGRCLSNTAFASDKDPLQTFLRQNVHQRRFKLEAVFRIVELVRHFLKKEIIGIDGLFSFSIEKGLDQHEILTPILKLIS